MSSSLPPSIHVFERGWLSSNNILCIGREDTALVDSGYATHARLDYLSADPVRNAQNAVKVLLKFLLLERRALALEALPGLLESIPLVERVRARVLGMDADELAQWATAALRKAGAARVEGAMLVDA